MDKKDISEHLTSWGWQVKKDNVGDKSGNLSLPDREVRVDWTIRGSHRRKTQKIVLSPAISTIDFSKMACHIYGTKSYEVWPCLLYTSPSPRDATLSRMPSSA